MLKPDMDNVFAGDVSSPDQLALVWSGAAEAVAASPSISSTAMPGEKILSYELDLIRLPADSKLGAALKQRREKTLNLPVLSVQTHFLTAVPYFSERTRILALPPEVLAFNDFELAEWLTRAEREMFLGTDNYPLFESPLEDTACSIVRLPNGQIAMTEVPRQHLQMAIENTRMLFGENAPHFSNLTVETPLRCSARYFLTALPEGAAVFSTGKELEVTAFLLVTEIGFSYGLWSPKTGLFSEYSFLAPTEINRKHQTTTNSNQSASYETATSNYHYGEKTAMPEPDVTEDYEGIDANFIESYIRHALEQLHLQFSKEKLNQLGLTSFARVAWIADPQLSAVIDPIANEYSTSIGVEFFRISVPVDEAVAGGLLFGSFTFGDETVAGAEVLPPVNLARDILVLADKEEVERRRIEEVRLQKRRGQAVFTLLAAPVLALACLLGLAANTMRSQISTGMREASADARTRELQPALDRRKSYEANLRWYQEFITQVSRLRRQQPVSIGLTHDLNSRYPLDIDPSFYVSELKLLVSGGVEIRGLARNKEAVTSFLRALEFAGGAGSGTKLFSNLTYEVQEGVSAAPPPTAGQPNLPTISSGPNLASNLPPGVVSWTMRGNYLPMNDFVPPDPNKKVPVPPPAAAAAASPVP